MKPEKIEVVEPKPYLLIKFYCSNRQFYGVKQELYDIWCQSGIKGEWEDLDITEKCDYEGDLEKIIIYNQEEVKPFLEKVCIFYGADFSKLCDMNLVLEC